MCNSPCMKGPFAYERQINRPAMTINNTTLVGWKSSPDGRGTYDIILTCLITTFLCCWTSVYPNIPAPDDTAWDAIRDRLGLACLGLLGPDFIIVLALGQKSSARRSVNVRHSLYGKGMKLSSDHSRNVEIPLRRISQMDHVSCFLRRHGWIRASCS